jgi:DNA-binding transcriptional MerR regulator
MTAPLLDIAELAVRSGVPGERLRGYAEAGLLPPASRDGDRVGYPPVEAGTMRLLAGADRLGLAGETLAGLADAWRTADCPAARRRLADAVSDRLALVQGAVAEQQRRMAESGPGSAEWAEATRIGVALFQEAARLQAVTGSLAAAAHTGPCGDTCGCAAAFTAPVTAYHFPADPAGGGAALLCDLAADGGDAHDRIDVWQQALARVQHRHPLPDDDPSQTGVVLRFPLDAELAAILARLAAAEYRCCSFGSYTIVIDGTGLRLEVRMPAEAAEVMAAVIGIPDPPVTEVPGAADQP